MSDRSKNLPKCAQSNDKSVQKKLGLTYGLVYDTSILSQVMIIRPEVTKVLQQSTTHIDVATSKRVTRTKTTCEQQVRTTSEL
jgi:hypothetical protein